MGTEVGEENGALGDVPDGVSPHDLSQNGLGRGELGQGGMGQSKLGQGTQTHAHGEQAFRTRINAGLDREVEPAISGFAHHLVAAPQTGQLGQSKHLDHSEHLDQAGQSNHQAQNITSESADKAPVAVLFYGSNLRTRSLEGVLDFYILHSGAEQNRIWPRVSFYQWEYAGQLLNAKVATLALSTFQKAASGTLRDTTIWARFVQPSALVWARDAKARKGVEQAMGEAAKTAARLAASLGPPSGMEETYWNALFAATYQAEFRVEKPGRGKSILDANRAHFSGLLPLALDAQNIACDGEDTKKSYVESAGKSIEENTGDGAGEIAKSNGGNNGVGPLHPHLAEPRRTAILHWWRRRRRWGKLLNLLRLMKASTTFEGGPRYIVWKVERHTGIALTMTPFREKHPLLAAPGALMELWWKRRGKN